jgi:hypothetical protein
MRTRTALIRLLRDRSQAAPCFGGNAGRLHLYGPEDTVSREVSISLRPSDDPLIACGRDVASTNEYGDEGRDRDTLIRRPGRPLRRRVLRDGFERR